MHFWTRSRYLLVGRRPDAFAKSHDRGVESDTSGRRSQSFVFVLPHFLPSFSSLLIFVRLAHLVSAAKTYQTIPISFKKTFYSWTPRRLSSRPTRRARSAHLTFVALRRTHIDIPALISFFVVSRLMLKVSNTRRLPPLRPSPSLDCLFSISQGTSYISSSMCDISVHFDSTTGRSHS